MRSHITSYNALFSRRLGDSPVVEHIEIPLIQRDYAQGRDGDATARIRTNFLEVLHRAVTGVEPANLDFVYGDVTQGTLRPLDGQQRLTTLFLLHWYLASRANRIEQEQGWKHFSYATRPSARRFCERLVGYRAPPSTQCLSAWIEDQPWYLSTWHHDPSVRAMLVMLDAMHARFRDDDCVAAWARLVDAEAPAISFHLLPIEQMGLSEDLYIKMNSRGKPLTPFENFKARFEQLIERSCPERVEEFARKVDGDWADVLWLYRGNDSLVDDEFLRYFQFVTELCAWREGRPPKGDLSAEAGAVYGADAPNAAGNLDFLMCCFDAWVGVDIPALFAAHFTAVATPVGPNSPPRLFLFGLPTGASVDLFAACCANYGQMQGRQRVFGWALTLVLYATLLHRIHPTQNFARRVRILRNLIEASGNELRQDRMPDLVADVKRIIVDGSLDGVTAFNQAQVADERLKAKLLEACPHLEPALHCLEDHSLLRGCIASFSLDEAVFEPRARAFHALFADPALFPRITGALLAAGNYARTQNGRMFQFGSGSNEAPWREVLTTGGRDQLAKTRDALGRLLDAVAAATGTLPETLDAFVANWITASPAANGLSWRWYFVRYPAMREGRSGLYATVNGALGYELCMLDKTQMNSWYRDPYLTAVHRESGVGGAIERVLFMGYETEARWLQLKASGTALRCIPAGFALRPPPSAAHTAVFTQVCTRHGVDADLTLKVPQVLTAGGALDTDDRVALGASLLRDLVKADL